ncbi:MAG: leucyl aminopeptidase [Chloroflexi bacterium]|nr:leucyl aminopeptidase [Chloroflexota bacterium]
MDIKVQHGNVVEHATPALVVNLFRGVRKPGGATGAIDQALGGVISKLIEAGEITGSSGEITVLHTAALGAGAGSNLPVAAERVLVAGLGKQDGFGYEQIRTISAQVARKLRSLKVSSAATIVHGAGIGGLDPAQCAEAIAEGSLLGLYRFTKYQSSASSSDDDDERPDGGPGVLELVESNATKEQAIEKGIARGVQLAAAATLARDLVNEPPNVLTPTALAAAAADMAKAAKLKFKVLEADDCLKMGMGSYLSVAAGSVQPPKFIHITYEGAAKSPEKNIWLVGKGITFDSGGLSLKPAASMVTMKGDMGGGAAVIGAMKAIAALKPKINVHAVCAATENMPGGSATRPGDVVKAMNGKFIEVENTDAEGRLTLADAICYAKENGAAQVIDVATLTGAVSVALGKGHIGAFSNNQKLYEAVESAAHDAGEPVWRLPLSAVTKRQNRSTIADIKNTGGRLAGSITAAHFIQEFAGDTPWAHLDIAALNMSEGTSGVNVPGATGASARLLVRLVESLA